MRISVKELNKLLSEEILKKITSLGEICMNAGLQCYLVGGTVRDVILKVPQIDIDIVTEGNAKLFKDVSKKLKIKKITFSQFNTAKLLFKDGFFLDIAQARKEIYPYPTSLPVVRRSSIHEDVKRRDFTINTLLMGITKKDFGKIYDYLGGIEDIEKGIIRALHKNSFIDDPTRIFRAFRFKERFSFRFDRETKNLMDNSIKAGYIKKLTPQRIRRELFLSLKEANWDKIIMNLSRSGVLKELGIKQKMTRSSITTFMRIIRNFNIKKQNWELSKLLIITENAQKKDIKAFSQKVGLRRNEVSILLELRRNGKRIVKTLSKKDLPNNKIYWLLEKIPIEGLFYLLSKGTPLSRKRIMLYLNNLKDKKINIKGDDLKKLGIKGGPIYKKILQKVLDEKLNRKLKSKKEEIEFVKRIIHKPSQL